MRKSLVVLLALALLSFGAVAYAHMWGDEGGPGYGGGYGMMGGGPGYGCGGPGGGYGPGYGMMGYGRQGIANATDEAKVKKFFEETTALRKEMHSKMFDLKEAYRANDEKKIDALEKEVEALRDKIQAKAKEAGFGRGWRGMWRN